MSEEFTYTREDGKICFAEIITEQIDASTHFEKRIVSGPKTLIIDGVIATPIKPKGKQK